jgi:hypothetical protein
MQDLKGSESLRAKVDGKEGCSWEKEPQRSGGDGGRRGEKMEFSSETRRHLQAREGEMGDWGVSLLAGASSGPFAASCVKSTGQR